MRIILLSFLLIFTSISFSQSVRSVNLNSYKYLVVDEVSGSNRGESRRFLVKNLRKAGYNVINLSKPLKTHNDYPEDLIINPSLGLCIYSNTLSKACYEVEFYLYNSLNQQVFFREGKSCLILSGAIKNSISSLTDFNYKYKSD